MKQKSTAPIPEEIIELQRELNKFRSTHRPRTKLPEDLWHAAVELARRHGLYRWRRLAAFAKHGNGVREITGGLPA